MKEKVLVIGGAGYLGSVLVERLLVLGYPVRILDSFIYGKKSVEAFKGNKDVEILEGDIRNVESVSSAIKNVSSVILLAAVVGDPASKARPEQTVETNFLAAQAISSACKRSGVEKFVYASTCSVYGVGADILDENAPLNPVSLYAKTKISSEESIMQMADSNFKPTIMRMSTLYGYSPRMRFDLVVNTMTMSAYLDKQINVFGGGQWRPLVHVQDAAEAYIKVLENDAARGKIYNVGSEKQNYKISEVANLVIGAVGAFERTPERTTAQTPGPEFKINTQSDNTDARDYRVSFKKINIELGFDVVSTIPDAALEIYAKLASKEIKDPKQKVYYNHYFDSSEELIG
jgi:nucleoside-diphosphate-sugar epimerase